jgi:urea transport system permease protein
LDLWLSQGFNALSLGSILLLIAIGLTFSFGLMNVINMAHGELIMVGAYVAYVVQTELSGAVGNGGNDVWLFVALPIAFVFAALLGAVLERLLIRRLYGRPLDTLLATWGVSLVLQQAARSIFGAPNVQVVAPSWLGGGLALTDDLVLPYGRIFILGLAALCVAGVALYLTRSTGGRRIRAVMQNRQMASSLGVRTPMVDTMTFALSSGLAGVAGCALTLIGPIGPSIGTYYIVDAFMVVVLGGVGMLAGAVAAAFSIGGLSVFLEWGTTASLAKVLVFLIIIGFLQFKPAGLIARRAR